MSDTEHTPTPWKTGTLRTRVEFLPNGWKVPVCVADCRANNAPETELERVANAALIVRAVNAHDALVSAVNHVLEASEDMGDMDDIDFDKLRDALALASGTTTLTAKMIKLANKLGDVLADYDLPEDAKGELASVIDQMNEEITRRERSRRE